MTCSEEQRIGARCICRQISSLLTFSRFSHRSVKILFKPWFVRLTLLNLKTLTDVNIWKTVTETQSVKVGLILSSFSVGVAQGVIKKHEILILF